MSLLMKCVGSWVILNISLVFYFVVVRGQRDCGTSEFPSQSRILDRPSIQAMPGNGLSRSVLRSLAHSRGRMHASASSIGLPHQVPIDAGSFIRSISDDAAFWTTSDPKHLTSYKQRNAASLPIKTFSSQHSLVDYAKSSCRSISFIRSDPTKRVSPFPFPFSVLY
jgi:hypothetical protein